MLRVAMRLAFLAAAASTRTQEEEEMYQVMCGANLYDSSMKCMCGYLEDAMLPRALTSRTDEACLNGYAGDYPCANADLLALVSLDEINDVHNGGSSSPNYKANDLWGWYDPQTGIEVALLGTEAGMAMVDVTDASNYHYLGLMECHGSTSIWGDIKTYKNYAFFVTESKGQGLQIFDLTKLRSIGSSEGPRLFKESAHFNAFDNAHNIFINEETGFAYVVGSSKCRGGLYMLDISTPLSPRYVGCFSQDGYTHDVHCVNYTGPDTPYRGKEICFACNEDTVTIVDVSNKSRPIQLSRTSYAGDAYTHQGWLSDDHRYFVFGDELDEIYGNNMNTRTLVLDVSDLNSPRLAGRHFSYLPVIDHNQYIKDGFIYQANYRGGLRVLRATDLSKATLTEVAYFDIYPEDNQAHFNGAWSVYPFFPSGNVIVSGIEQGLFVVKVDVNAGPSPPQPTLPPSSPCPQYGLDPVYVFKMRYDRNPRETQWSLRDVAEGKTLYFWGYGRVKQSGKIIKFKMPKIVPGRAYQLIFRDSYGDGMRNAPFNGARPFGRITKTENCQTYVLADENGKFSWVSKINFRA